MFTENDITVLAGNNPIRRAIGVLTPVGKSRLFAWSIVEIDFPINFRLEGITVGNIGKEGFAEMFPLQPWGDTLQFDRYKILADILSADLFDTRPNMKIWLLWLMNNNFSQIKAIVRYHKLNRSL